MPLRDEWRKAWAYARWSALIEEDWDIDPPPPDIEGVSQDALDLAHDCCRRRYTWDETVTRGMVRIQAKMMMKRL